MTVVKSNYLGLLNADLASLTYSLDTDGSINRADMIQILYCVESEGDGVVDAADFSDLKTILKDSSTLNIVNYVLVLANDVVNGNAANAHYLGQTLGNLAAGSSNAQLEKLIDKWFYGTDLPATGGYSYDTVTAGTLYGSSGPSHADEKQGNLGDCYLISALGSVADSSQAAAKNMIIDNGDGTWTVRFYSNGTADYVTVNSQLPVDSKGNLIFDGYGTSSTSGSNVLWLELLEKAYAQWNETGREGRSAAANSYASIEGGLDGRRLRPDAQLRRHRLQHDRQRQANAHQRPERRQGRDDRHRQQPGLQHRPLRQSRLQRPQLRQLHRPVHALQSLGEQSAREVDLEPVGRQLRRFRRGRHVGRPPAAGCKARSLPRSSCRRRSRWSRLPPRRRLLPPSNRRSGLGSSDAQEPARPRTAAADAVFAGYGDSAGRLLPSADVAMYRFSAERVCRRPGRPAV